MESAVLELQDLTDEGQEQPYNGPERRVKQRRVKSDRRVEVRFEPDKEDRRQNPGRRAGDRAAFARRNYTI